MQSLGVAYVELLRSCLDYGEDRVARGMPHRSLFNVVFKHDVFPNLLSSIEKKFAIAELMSYVCGWDDEAWLARFNKNIAQFSDDGKVFRGAYGPRISPHLGKVMQLLVNDSETRQAVVPIYDSRDVAVNSRDIPCNTHFQLQVIDNQLCMSIYQRSCDLIWGLPYDSFTFSTLLFLIAEQIGWQVGSVTRFIANAHVYNPEAGYANESRIAKAFDNNTFAWIPHPSDLNNFIDVSRRVRSEIEHPTGNFDRWLLGELT